MTNKMRTALLMDAIRRHRDATDNHFGDCCVQARLAAQEMVKQAETAEKSVAATVAPVQIETTKVAAPKVTEVAPRPTRRPTGPGQIASPGQIQYISDLLELRDVASYWRKVARELIVQDYPSYDEARRILAQLTKMPVLPGVVRRPTPRMTALLSRLLVQKEWPNEVDVTRLSFEQARELIDALLLAPNKPREESPERATSIHRALPAEGFYLYEGEYYKVQFDVHGSGRKTCKKLHLSEVQGEKGTFRRQGGMGGKLAAEHKLTLEQAKEFGKLYGQCVCCGAILTNEESIAKGIGPICEGKYF